MKIQGNIYQPICLFAICLNFKRENKTRMPNNGIFNKLYITHYMHDYSSRRMGSSYKSFSEEQNIAYLGSTNDQ